jgi:hypothetical protein
MGGEVLFFDKIIVKMGHPCARANEYFVLFVDNSRFCDPNGRFNM